MTKSKSPTKAQGRRTAQRGPGRNAKPDRPQPRRPGRAKGRGPTAATAGPLAERRRPAQSALTGPGTRGPLWVPDGVDLEVVPEEVREAIAEVVQPVYERFVLGVDDPLEKSLGVTVAHLLWLEVLQQFDMKREYTQVSAVLGLSGNRSSAIEQHLRIIYSKVKVGYLLARLRELRRKWPQGSAGGASLPGPAGAGEARGGAGVSPALAGPLPGPDEHWEDAGAAPRFTAGCPSPERGRDGSQSTSS